MTRDGEALHQSVGELMNVAPIFRYFAELAGRCRYFVAAPTAGALQYAKYHPYGVSAHIVL